MPSANKYVFHFQQLHLLLIWGFIILFIFMPDIAHAGAQMGALLFAKNLLPYLLPYIILTQWLLKTTAPQQNQGWRNLLKLYTLGSFGGFPVGAVTLAEMTKRKELTVHVASLLLGICHAPGPMFVIGFVGNEILHNEQLGWKLLLAIHLVNLFLFIVMFPKIRVYKNIQSTVQKPSFHLTPQRFPLIHALKESTHILLLVATTVIFFSSLGIVLAHTVSEVFTVNMKVTETLLLSFFEMTAGISSAASYLEDLDFFPLLIAAILTANGLSIHIQVLAIAKTAHLSIRPYLLMRMISIILVPIIFSFML